MGTKADRTSTRPAPSGYETVYLHPISHPSFTPSAEWELNRIDLLFKSQSHAKLLALLKRVGSGSTLLLLPDEGSTTTFHPSHPVAVSPRIVDLKRLEKCAPLNFYFQCFRMVERVSETLMSLFRRATLGSPHVPMQLNSHMERGLVIFLNALHADVVDDDEVDCVVLDLFSTLF